MRSLFASFGLVALLALSGCTSQNIYQDESFNPAVYFGRHTVKAGETLYSIAWRYGRDYRELADANAIAPPYVIKPGQVIRLDLRGSAPIDLAPEKKEKPLKTVNNSSNEKKVNTNDKRRTQSAPAAVTKNSPTTTQTHKWRWPHSGPIIATYSAEGAGNRRTNRPVNKGIDIAGTAGDVIVAAADGVVVYAGEGLLGYGKLIIVNHDEHYLSAYAHNRSILVKEGQKVSGGDKIAEMGDSGTHRVMLHFEVRKDGQPVDPAKYLPPRR